MANLGKLLKEEIVRLSKKNAAALAKPLNTQIRTLKHQVRTLAASLKTLEAAVRKGAAAAPDANDPDAVPAKGRAFTAKNVKALRARFKITQSELAKLAKVSSQAVVMWEHKTGKIRLRHATYDALAAVRAMRKADVKAALGIVGKAKKK